MRLSCEELEVGPDVLALHGADHIRYRLLYLRVAELQKGQAR